MAERDVDNVSEEDIIGFNLRAFLPYIQYCIPATQLLTHLHYYNRDQRKTIFALHCQRPHEATAMALQVLLDLEDEQGQFTALRDALHTEGYPKIVNILTGKYIPSDFYDEKVVQLLTPTIINQLNPIEILPYLIKYEVIGELEKEEVRAEEMNHGAMRASFVLLSYLPSRTEDWFKYFIQALIDCQHEDLARELEPDLYTKIMAQRMEESGDRYDTKETVTTGNSDVQEHVISVGEEADVDLGASNSIPTETVSSTSISSRGEEIQESLEFNELLEDDVVLDDLTEKESLEGNEKDALERNEKDALEGNEKDALERNKKEIQEKNEKEIQEGNEKSSANDTPFRDDVNTNDETVDSLTEVKQVAKMTTDSRTDRLIRYDRRFLLSLRQSDLANYVPTQVLKYPEIMDISSIRLNNGVNDLGNIKTIYTRSASADSLEIDYNISPDNLGARPKVPNPQTRKDRAVNGTLNANVEEPKDIEELEKDLENLLLDGLNDLGHVETIYRRSASADSLEIDYNISTDSDQLDEVEDKDVELRNYQKELAIEGIAGENVIIMAPTNSGKTRVAMRVVQEHIRRQKREQRISLVIFLCQDETLAIQQARSFAEHLPAYRTKIISGSTQREKKEFLKDFVDRRDVLVVTAQVLINALINNEIKDLTRFTMIVFDECHHANKNHPYNQILSKYMDLKLVQNINMDEMPQIVGMTASLGCGGNLKEDLALQHMKQVMANMDACCLCTVRRYTDQLRQYINPPVEEVRQVNRRTNNSFGVVVNQIIDNIDRLMVSHIETTEPDVQSIVPRSRGNEQFLQWLAAFKKQVAKAKKETARLFNPCRLHLIAYNMALMIYKDARIKEAMKIIHEFMMEYALLKEKDDTDNYLLELYEELQIQSFDNEPENPKLLEMQRIMLDVLGQDQNARGIVFVKTRELARALVSWMKDTEELRQFQAEVFVGQQAPAHKGGTTLHQQIDIMEYFKDGHHRILFATSVLEEGLDVSKCNLVIRYEHVTNEIVRLQSRGRARASDSKYYVLTETGSWIVAKEEKNKLLEDLMNRLVPILQGQIENNQNEWQREMRTIQQDVKDKEILKKKQREEMMTDKPISIQCLNCQTEICKSTDIKIIQNAHHVIVGKEAAEKFLYIPSPQPEYEEEDLQYHGCILCVNCFHTLGGICEYRHTQFPLLKIGLWRTSFGITYKKWKKVTFVMQNFTLDDLREVVERMNM